MTASSWAPRCLGSASSTYSERPRRLSLTKRENLCQLSQWLCSHPRRLFHYWQSVHLSWLLQRQNSRINRLLQWQPRPGARSCS